MVRSRSEINRASRQFARWNLPEPTQSLACSLVFWIMSHESHSGSLPWHLCPGQGGMCSSSRSDASRESLPFTRQAFPVRLSLPFMESQACWGTRTLHNCGNVCKTLQIQSQQLLVKKKYHELSVSLLYVKSNILLNGVLCFLSFIIVADMVCNWDGVFGKRGWFSPSDGCGLTRNPIPITAVTWLPGIRFFFPFPPQPIFSATRYSITWLILDPLLGKKTVSGYVWTKPILSSWGTTIHDFQFSTSSNLWT